MVGMVGRWIGPGITENATGDEPSIALARELGIEPLTARVLAVRGWTDPVAARSFIDPKLAALHDPSLLPGCDRAAARMLDAARSGEPIAIYGDYDVDGVTATVILTRMLRHLAPNCDVRTYVPDRETEGYGLNAAALRDLADAGAGLIVSVDCGITAVEPARAAIDAGIDLIITDHHNIPGEETGVIDPAALPEAYTLVHPRLTWERLGSDARAVEPYPWGELCGAGVAFKLAWRLAVMAGGGEGRVDAETRELLMDLLALAGLGTIADIVPLEDENRLIARFGLAKLKHTSVTGMDALLEVSGLAGESVDAEAAGFMLGPRLNACGRMGHAREAVELLLTDDAERARELAEHLDAQNRSRQSTERGIAKQAAELAEAAGMTGTGRRAIVLADESWHAGVVGIVCSRLVGLFHRPVVLLRRENGECRGSARSIDGYSIHAGLSACADYLTRFGGHDMAAGLALESAKLDRFIDALCAHADEHVSDDMLVPRVRVDCGATLDELSPNAVRELDRLGPFGRANPKPAILVSGVRVTEAATMGRSNTHLRLRISATEGRANGRFGGMKLVGWNWAERVGQVRVGDVIDCVIRPKLNVWQGRVSVEGEVVDLGRGEDR